MGAENPPVLYKTFLKKQKVGCVRLFRSAWKALLEKEMKTVVVMEPSDHTLSLFLLKLK